ncbi:MAG TPA: DUF2769 domain-containing protein [Methanothermobacter sp.]|nr:DUF2769 domain-containing protein [Methanothermobacter sp.]
MDKFEKILEKMLEMSENQLNTLIEMQKKRICICRECPSFNECMNENKEGLFCILGNSSCRFELIECKCGECPVHIRFQMKYGLYCVEGSEEEQRSKKK